MIVDLALVLSACLGVFVILWLIGLIIGLSGSKLFPEKISFVFVALLSLLILILVENIHIIVKFFINNSKH